jgi:hypothetical protein
VTEVDVDRREHLAHTARAEKTFDPILSTDQRSGRDGNLTLYFACPRCGLGRRVAAARACAEVSDETTTARADGGVSTQRVFRIDGEHALHEPPDIVPPRAIGPRAGVGTDALRLHADSMIAPLDGLRRARSGMSEDVGSTYSGEPAL